MYYKSVSAIAGGGKTAVLLNTFSKGLARCSGSNWVFFPDPNWLCAPGANNGGFLRKITVLFELWGGSNQLWPKRVEMSAIPCGAWVSGISQSGLKNPAPDVNLPKSYNTRNQFEGNLTRVRIPPAAPKEEETHSRLFLFVLHLLPLLPPEVDRQHDRGVDQRGGEDNEREVALHLVARRRETLDE